VLQWGQVLDSLQATGLQKREGFSLTTTRFIICSHSLCCYFTNVKQNSSSEASCVSAVTVPSYPRSELQYSSTSPVKRKMKKVSRHSLNHLSSLFACSVVTTLSDGQSAIFSVLFGEERMTKRVQKSTVAKFETSVWSLPRGAEDNIAIRHSALLAFVSKFQLGSVRKLSCSAILSTATFRHLT
jgi:hypothetical protein